MGDYIYNVITCPGTNIALCMAGFRLILVHQINLHVIRSKHIPCMANNKLAINIRYNLIYHGISQEEEAVLQE